MGSELIFERGISQVIALPAAMDRVESEIIGTIIGKCSFIDIKAHDRLGAHRTTIMKRIE
jgi:hypothetical protein